MLKQLILTWAPPGLRALARGSRNLAVAVRNYHYDLARFLSHSSVVRISGDKERFRSTITIDNHRIEKGLSLRSPRAGFGKDVLSRLIRNAAAYQRDYGSDELMAIVANVLAAYRSANENADIDFSLIDGFLSKVSEELKEIQTAGGGTLGKSQEELFPFNSSDIFQFLGSRHSVRQFDGSLISKEVLTDAIILAQRSSPSVCNRQCARVFASNDRESMRRILGYQNGNSGFGDSAGAVFVIAADIRAFTAVGERNQAWVDGGMFALALSLALHSMKLGTCMLNWSVEHGRDKSLRKELGIEDRYAIVTLMCAGNLPTETIRVAASPRRKVDEIVRWMS